jgi:tetrahydromethanopterin S-methyltransferase subunit G
MRRASNMAEENDVKKQLDSIQKQLDDIRTVVFEQKSSDLGIYWSIVISAFVGIVGNAMV